jgi:hypothetical protein
MPRRKTSARASVIPLANVSLLFFLVLAQAMNSAAAAEVGRAFQSNTPARLSGRPSGARHRQKVHQLRFGHRLPAGKAQRAPPNPSLKLTHYGVRCKPGALHMVHHRAPGLQHTPPWAT